MYTCLKYAIMLYIMLVLLTEGFRPVQQMLTHTHLV